MTPEQLKQNPITVCPNQKLDTDEGDSMKDEEEFTISSEISEVHSTSDIPTEITEESRPTETSQILAVFNTSKHDENNTSENKSVTEIEPPKENGEQNNGKDNKLLTTNFEVKMENQKVEGLITFSFEQQYSNSKLILEVAKKYGEFILILNHIN